MHSRTMARDMIVSDRLGRSRYFDASHTCQQPGAAHGHIASKCLKEELHGFHKSRGVWRVSIHNERPDDCDALASGGTPAFLGDRKEPMPLQAVDDDAARSALRLGSSPRWKRIEMPIDRRGGQGTNIEDRCGLAAALLFTISHRCLTPAGETRVVSPSATSRARLPTDSHDERLSGNYCE
jgi:hypothetical protein